MKTLIIKTALTWVVVHCGDGNFVEHDLMDGKLSKATVGTKSIVAICVPPNSSQAYFKLAQVGGELCPENHVALDWCSLAK